MLIANLSSHDQKLYRLIAFAFGVAFILGLLCGLISFSGNGDVRVDNWKPTGLPEQLDNVAEFTTVSTQTRWFMPAGAAEAITAEAAKKSAAGSPDAYKLLGIVDTKGKKMALFLPIESSSVQGTRKIKQLSEGDTLIDDWKIKEVTASKVILIAEHEGKDPQTKDVLLYATSKP